MRTLEDLKKIRKIEIKTRKLVNTVFSGSYHSIFKGQGMEFSEVREYLPGDDIRSIDWNVTARMGYPYIKKFSEERELTVIFMLDVSASEGFGTRMRLKRELAAEIASVMAFSAIKNNDRVGSILFTDRVESYTPPKKGKTHTLRIIRDLLYFNPEGKKTSIDTALEYLLHVQKRTAIVFLISDFLSDGYEKQISLAAGKYDLIAIELKDPFEKKLPDMNWVQFRDPEGGEKLLLDTSNKKFRDEYLKWQEDFNNNTHQLLSKNKVEIISLMTDGDYELPLVQFFAQREKRLKMRR